MRWAPIAARVFVVTAVAFALVGLVWTTVPVAVIGGAAFGVYMTAVVVGLNAYKLRAHPEVALTNRQTANLVLPMTAADLHARAVSALTALPARITSDSGSRIEARTGVSMSSWGEILRIEFVATHGGPTAVSLESRPRGRAALISDYRRTHGIVDRLAVGLSGPPAGAQHPTVSRAPGPGPALS